MINENSLPVIIIDLVRRMDPNNKLTNENEKAAAELMVRNIISYCEAGLTVQKDYLKLR